MAWAENYQRLHRRMKGLTPGNFVRESGRMYAATNLVLHTIEDMVRCNEISRNEYCADDMLQAARLMLAWSEDSENQVN